MEIPDPHKCSDCNITLKRLKILCFERKFCTQNFNCICNILSNFLIHLYVRKDLRAQAETLLPLHLEKGLNVALDKCLLLEVGIGRSIEHRKKKHLSKGSSRA
jgi:hypothetical protein